jgi:hypothetical protein
MEKENVPPQIRSNTIQKLTKTNRVPTTNPIGEWSSESLETTMDVIEKNIIFLWGAASFGAYPYP